MSFVDRLKAMLVLKPKGKELTVPAGNIKRLSVEVHSYGFSASVEWWAVSQVSASEDELFEHFVKKDPIEAVLKLDRAYDVEGGDASGLELTGLVEERWVHERAFSDVQDAPVLQRRYRVRFSDRATVLWRQHFPTGVWVDQKFQEVIEAHKPDGVELSFNWEAAKIKLPLHTLGLGAEGNAASFHDFIHWLLARENAGLFYDPATGKYELSDSKPKGGEAIELPRDDVAELEVCLPEPRRDHPAVLNSYVEAGTREKKVDNANKMEGVRQEYLLTSPLESTLTDRATLEGKRQRAPEPELCVHFRRYPSITLLLNGLYGFGEDWSTKLYTNGKKYRLYRLELRARAELGDPSDTLNDETNNYEMEMTATLELEADPTFRRPSFIRPRWPFYVEGKVVSEVGQDDELTYEARQDSDTSLEYYRVKLPLWDKEVLVPYDPHQQPGHFYFPADKGARVLIALDFRSAVLERFLAWRPGAKLPKESQGNHLLLGKKPESETSIRHIYEDSKPLLRILRTSDKDTQLIEVAEGRLKIQVKEEK
ncbi:hypothetical protein [Vitiosangium sp. GDMCC 1.1324]|uniref:hypothetical protein n=1 Tax=Vitiosangium sp. (strain GDMCC 1.1324) TaxID=2138576 RepID=UPI000D3C3137|nr:hypothetical protein [Vitiosangium sp. GDMCC 1.1324]PTL80736.1 hypothetical protein DAT35_25625 [Vitiosangium sp. GDMCC 1.1324]